jgi:hypothetical protein
MYYADADGIQAFVFGSPEPTMLWAWYVVWSIRNGAVGSTAGVEHSFRSAQNKAETNWLTVEAARDKRGF